MFAIIRQCFDDNKNIRTTQTTFPTVTPLLSPHTAARLRTFFFNKNNLSLFYTYLESIIKSLYGINDLLSSEFAIRMCYNCMLLFCVIFLIDLQSLSKKFAVFTISIFPIYRSCDHIRIFFRIQIFHFIEFSKPF